MNKLKETNIYDRLTICVNDKDRTFYLLDNKNNIILYFIKDLDTAIAIKKAYCDGYVDRKNEENKDD